MKSVTLLVAVLTGAAMAVVTAYHIDPVRADWSGKADPEDGVSEIITVAFDLPVTASLFCGSPGAGGTYSVGIYSYPGGVARLAEKLNVSQPLDHHWLTCSLDVIYPDSFIKGRQVEVRWTRGGSDSIHYYTRDGTTYPYGFMRVGQQDHNSLDLCMRVA